MKIIKKSIIALILALILSFTIIISNGIKAKADTIWVNIGNISSVADIPVGARITMGYSIYNYGSFPSDRGFALGRRADNSASFTINDINVWSIIYSSNPRQGTYYYTSNNDTGVIMNRYPDYTSSTRTFTFIVVQELQGWERNTLTGTYTRNDTYSPLIDLLNSNYITIEVPQPTTYTITFNANGGTGTPPASVEVNAGENYFPPSTTTLTPPTQYQYFNGWATDPNASVGVYYIVVNSDTTLYAIWAYTQYTITYDANGGAGTPPASYTANAGSTINVSQTNPTNLTAPHKHFAGWSTSSTGTTQTTSFVLTQNTTLYAIWVLDNYTITFNVNGGTGTPPAQITLEYGTTYHIPGNTTNLTREGFTFQGWNTSSTAQTGLNQIIIENNTTLYAIWRIDRSDELKIYLNDNLVGQYSITTTGTSAHYMIAFDGFDIALFELYLNGGELSPQYQSNSYILSSNMNNIVFTLSGENIYTLLIYNNDTLEEDWTYDDLVENGTAYIHFYNGGDIDIKIYTRQGINTDTESLINTFKMLFKGANEILNIRFGWITIGGILAIVLSIGVIFFIFKLIRGGL